MPAPTIAFYGQNGQKDVCFRLWGVGQTSAVSSRMLKNGLFGLFGLSRVFG